MAFGFSLCVYLGVLATYLYFAGFVGGVAVPKAVDDGASLPMAAALSLDLALIALFGLQHGVMARPGFARRLARIAPRPVERSLHVLASTIALAALMWLWRPIPAQIWLIENPAGAGLLWALFALGWTVMLLSTFATGHFDMVGLRQSYLAMTGRPHAPVAFTTRGPYRLMRHPLYAGLMLALWATPDMTAGHLVLAIGLSAFVMVGARLEERDLTAAFGARYRAYRRATPAFLPRAQPIRV